MANIAALRQLDLSRLVRRLVCEDGLCSHQSAVAAIAEYKRFLRLAQLHPGERMQPPKDVDAVWQRHLLDTKAYEIDCIALFGTHAHRVYEYDDSVVDLPEGSVTCARLSLQQTRTYYEEAFGTAPPTEMWSQVPAIAPARLSTQKMLPTRAFGTRTVPVEIE
eukprot:SAG31_NODE_14079_length_828_cov_1.106996_1_plen_162_part_01